MSKGSELFDTLASQDHPLARKLKELHAAAFALPTTDDAEKFILEWKKNNPEEARAMGEFIFGDLMDERESRREVKSELGYSRIGRNNV